MQCFVVGGGVGVVGWWGQWIGGDQVVVSVVVWCGVMGGKGYMGGEQQVGSGIRYDLYDSCR